MTVNVLVSTRFPEGLLERVRAVSPEVRLSYAPLRDRESLPSSTVA